MSLFQLKEWLGHRSLNSTEHYAKITPTTLTQAYDKADYFKRNTRLIDVLIDREAGTGSGSGAKPWIYYDLGHGYCTNDFFATCPHRMACAKCDFYVIKSSSKVQTLEARGNLVKMMQALELTEDERAAAEGDIAAIDRLVTRTKDLPALDGHTKPRSESSTTKDCA
jgi:hypothetical protein